MVKFGRKFFFDTKHSKKRKIITYIIIGVVVILLIILLALIIRAINKGKNKKVKPKTKTEIVLREKVDAQLYEPLPDKTAYFEVLENFDVNSIDVKYPDYLPLEPIYDNCNDDELKILEEIQNGKNPEEYNNPYACVTYAPTGIGAYDVTVNYNNKDYVVTLNVVDTKAPTLVAKNLEIIQGEKYSASSFVESCVDNSKKDCTYDYYYKDYSPNVNYGEYTEPGTYEIAIVAIDGSGNTTVPENVTLIITEKKIQVYTVKFNSNGGSSVDTQFINEGEKATAPANPTRSGYTFAGWYTSGSNKFNFSNAITSDITLTAKWNKNKTKTTPKKKTTTCTYGDLEYDTKKYPVLALKVSDGKCAMDEKAAKAIYLTKGSVLAKNSVNDLSKMQSWLNSNEYCAVSLPNKTPKGEVVAVPNKSGKGIVGYVVGWSIVKADKVDVANGKCYEPVTEVARYYLNEKGERVFTLNLINMPK